MKNPLFNTGIVLVLTGALLAFSTSTPKVLAQLPAAVSVPPNPIPEADDFSTTLFGDAWDMSEFTDISLYLNGAGRHVTLTNVQVQNGLFSARSLGDNTSNLAFFDPLFAGYEGFMQFGNNNGKVHSIVPTQFACLYIAIKVNSPQYVPGSGLPDLLLIGWNAGRPVGGVTPSGKTFIYLYPESTVYPYPPVVHNYKLYKVNLANPPNGLYDGSTPWLGLSDWQELQINPTIYRDVNFSVDWIRLTSCQDQSQYQAQIGWTPDPNVTAIWARSIATNANILLASGLNGSSGSYTLDTKGLAAGEYQIGTGTHTTCCSQWSTQYLVINQRPVAHFTRPSPGSGEDYATVGGNPWDIYPNDVNSIRCTNWAFNSGILILDTPYPAAMPSSCWGPGVGEVDSQIYLQMPTPLTNGGEYRYLNFYHSINGEYAIPADGMVGRWIWTTSDNCTYISKDIAYDVNWHEYNIDLYDPINGTPIASSPSSCGLKPWSQAGQIIRLRFDPNENWTGNIVPSMVFHEEIDWLRLQKISRVTRGESFTIVLELNKPVSTIQSFQYYYTTDPENPTQHPAERTTNHSAPRDVLFDEFTVFLPIATKDYSPFRAIFHWDTTTVTPGQYYICARIDDGVNVAINCSEAPVEVTAP